MIPRWIAQKRKETCAHCEIVKICPDKMTLLNEVPFCSLSKLHSVEDELRWAKAWPETAPRVSGCCDSALHPAS